MDLEPELDLFGTPVNEGPFDRLLRSLRQLAEALVRKWELPPRGVSVSSNYGQKGKSNDGKIVSYSMSINEPDYPATEDDLRDENRVKVKCVTFWPSDTKIRQGFVETAIRNAVLARIEIPSGSLSLPQDKTDRENDCRKLAIPVDADGIVDFFRGIVELKLKVYESARAAPFGCCSLFEECSDANRCIHPNRLYSTACAYRHNLESGRIFYGRNKNI